MRALLINPWIHDFAAYDLWSKPLGLLKISEALEEAGFELALIDCLDRFHPALKNSFDGKLPKSTSYGSGPYFSEAIEKPKIFSRIPRKFKRYGLPLGIFRELVKSQEKPDVVLVTSGMTYWYPGVIETVSIIHEYFPRTPVVLGGIYANLAYEHAKKMSGADIVYKGNSVDDIVKLAKNITSYDGKQCGRRGKRFCGYDLYEELKYITLRTSNGCPFRCSYCGWYLLDGKFSQHDPEKVVDNIETFYNRRNIRNFAFYDEALLYNADKHILKIMEGIIANKIKANFHTPNGLHARFITDGIARLMKNSGFANPRIALETTSEKRQFETGWKTTTKEFVSAVSHLRNAGYDSHEIGAYVLIGLPGQDTNEIRSTVEFVLKEGLRPFLEEYSPIPGTAYYIKSGLTEDSDPLLHNNSAFPLVRPEEYGRMQELKAWTHEMNAKLLLEANIPN